MRRISRIAREYTHALRLVYALRSKAHTDLRAGYANSCVLLCNTPRDSHRESPKKRSTPEMGVLLFLVTRRRIELLLPP